MEASQYFPYLNQSRVIALSAASAMTFHGGSQTAPSYLQPYLGSSHRLRGFRRYRFHDDNLIHFSAEHRWDAFSMLDVALFVDAGKVAPKRSQLNLHNLEYSAGFGFRFTVRSGVFMRIDTAFSREGVELWWSWSDAF